MGVETSTKKTEPLDQSNRIIAKGKRKGESYGQALSLQDVFSDSANLSGMQQKTSFRPKLDRENWSQLQKKE